MDEMSAFRNKYKLHLQGLALLLLLLASAGLFLSEAAGMEWVTWLLLGILVVDMLLIIVVT